MTCPSTVVLVLLSCAISMSPWPRNTVVTASGVGRPQSPFVDRMALFQHVLLNDAQWSRVLKQKVKLSNLSLPTYRRFNSNDSVVDRIELMTKDDDQNPTAMYVLQKLMEKSPWSGTNVNYTAYVLSTAITCFTYNNVSFVLTLIVDRIGFLVRKMRKPVKNKDDKEDKKDDKEDKKEDQDEGKKEGKKENKKEKDEADSTIKDKVDEALDDVRMTFVVFMDKVAAVDGELAFLASALYDYDGAEKTKNDLVLFKVLEMIKKEVDIKLERHCHPTDVYKYLSKYETLNVSPTPPDELTPDDETLTRELIEFDKIIDCILDVYDGLDVETMPMKTWILILEYTLPISMNIKFYVDGTLKVPTKPNPEDAMSERLGDAINEEKKGGIEGEKKKKKKKNKKEKKEKKNKKEKKEEKEEKQTDENEP